MQLSTSQGKHQRVAACDLRVRQWSWPLAERNAAAIDSDWQRRKSVANRLFNGQIYLFSDYRLQHGRLEGTLFQTDFKTLLYWRSLPYAASDSVREASVASLIRSAEGHLLFGRQAPGQLNTGLIYPPSGVIDANDVIDDTIDIDASIQRELSEETGLSLADLSRVPGYQVATVGIHVTIGIEWRSSLPATQLRERILAFTRTQSQPELEDIAILRREDALPRSIMPPHARVFAEALLAGDCT